MKNRGSISHCYSYALDYAAETPVIDLLPDLGSSNSYARRINENGDIVGHYTEFDGSERTYFYHPGYYSGDPLLWLASAFWAYQIGDHIPLGTDPDVGAGYIAGVGGTQVSTIFLLTPVATPVAAP